MRTHTDSGLGALTADEQSLPDEEQRAKNDSISTVTPCVALFCGAIQDRQSDLERTLNFQACLQGSKKSTKTNPKASEIRQNRPSNYENTFLGNIHFLQYP